MTLINQPDLSTEELEVAATNRHAKKTRIVNKPYKSPRTKRATRTETCPIAEQDAKFGEYLHILEQELVQSDRKKEIKTWALKEILALKEEGEDTFIESSDGTMRFSIREDKTFLYPPQLQARIDNHAKEAKLISIDKKRSQVLQEAVEANCKRVMVFKGPKIV